MRPDKIKIKKKKKRIPLPKRPPKVEKDRKAYDRGKAKKETNEKIKEES